jgi:hypothetical protein
MDSSGIRALDGWTSGCLECATRAVASQLQAPEDWYAFSDAGVSKMVFSPSLEKFAKKDLHNEAHICLADTLLKYRDRGSRIITILQRMPG